MNKKAIIDSMSNFKKQEKQNQESANIANRSLQLIKGQIGLDETQQERMVIRKQQNDRRSF